jgi:general L-amino acid transport system substrate-binding protein
MSAGGHLMVFLFKLFVRSSIAAFAACIASHATAAQTLKAVQERGELICGVSQGVIGFSSRSQTGEWSGFDVDLCRAIAAAIFNDPGKVRYVPLSAEERFAALQSNRIDVLSRNSTWTMSRETELGLLFAAVTYYDGQAFMVRHDRKRTSALELTGSRVCVQAGTTTELNLRDYFQVNGMTYQPVAAASMQEALAAYEEGRCDAFTADASALHGERLKIKAPDDHDILPELISREPLGPAVRQDDVQWFNLVKWIAFAMLNAEELDVSSGTIGAAFSSAKPDVMRLVGSEGSFGEQLGLSKDWAARVIRLVGNYAEVYERNVGVKSRLGIPRGINQLWNSGGILYAPPIR